MAKKKTAKTTTRKRTAESGGSSKPEQKAGRGITGKTLGLSIRDTWKHLFQENEKAAKGSKKTDEQLQQFMRDEFPGRTGHNFTSPGGVQAVRNYYNAGNFDKGEIPEVPSQKYNEEGEAVTSRGKPLSQVKAEQDGTVEKAAATPKPKSSSKKSDTGASKPAKKKTSRKRTKTAAKS